jgi:hypothetical protein
LPSHVPLPQAGPLPPLLVVLVELLALVGLLVQALVVPLVLGVARTRSPGSIESPHATTPTSPAATATSIQP